MKLSETIDFALFYEKVKNQKLPISTAYKLSRIYHQIQDDETFYQTQLREIFHKYGELDEQGNLIPIEDGRGIKIRAGEQSACLAAIEELQNTESAIIFQPLTLEELKTLEVAPSDIDSIIGFISQE